MKLILPYLVLLLFLIGCKNDEKLAFEPLSIRSEACSACPEISIELPNAISQAKISKAVNAALREEIISLLLYDDTMEVTTLNQAMASFKNGYLALAKVYNDETTPWKAAINATVSFENTQLLTIELDAYIFMGGAHGYTTKRLLNFDKKKGIELENWQLFKDAANFQVFAETVFRKKEAIPLDKSINHTGFMFEQDSFYLPENIGFTQEGIKLLYNQYEVASFADGAIEIILSHDEVKNYLSEKI